ncbi:MAG TPA: PstS family phosphate ABC transporter substrate-binding protein [Thermodesulfobacteriota bacterium]|nr:PstS family phosphate ABC transporter substrate-binding protein [Thermodesulfobacteriota bacterium]
MVSLFFAVDVTDVARAATKEIKVDGSSTVYPVTEGAAEDFQNMRRGEVNITVGISGTGGGFKKFCRGETDISDASRPIKTSEIEACQQAGIEYVELPVCFDALANLVNLNNNWVDCMTVEELKKIWEPEAQGKITRWNQIRPEWPDKDLRLCGAGVDSGTYDYYTEAIVGKEHSSRGDFTASEDDNVLVQFVNSQDNALCFFPYAYYFENKDKAKLIKVKNPTTGECVLPSAENVINGSYQPLSRPIFIYVNAKSAEKPEVKEFVELYLSNASDYCTSVGYVALPDEAYKLGLQKFKSMKKGTTFAGGSTVGVKIEDMVKH